jgi:hypothetical protein
MYVHPQVHEEITSSKANLIAIIKFDDLTDAVASEAQTLTLFTLPVAALVKHVTLELPTSFQNAVAAYDSVTVQVGTDDDDDNFLTATQIDNRSGSPAIFPIYDSGDAFPFKILAAHPKVVATFTPKSTYKLADLTGGELRLLFDIFIPQTGT